MYLKHKDFVTPWKCKNYKAYYIYTIYVKDHLVCLHLHIKFEVI
jgi:hypothetical protein